MSPIEIINPGWGRRAAEKLRLEDRDEVTFSEWANMLGVDPKRLNLLIQKEQIETRQMGKTRLICVDQLPKIIQGLQKSGKYPQFNNIDIQMDFVIVSRSRVGGLVTPRIEWSYKR